MEGWQDWMTSSKAYVLRSSIEKSYILIGQGYEKLVESLQFKDDNLLRALGPISSVKASLEEIRNRAESRFRSQEHGQKVNAAMKVVQRRKASHSVCRKGVPNMVLEGY